MSDTAQGDGTVGKALDVLDQVAGFGRPVRFSELLDASPYPKATLYRLLQTLTKQGMVSFDPDRSAYSLGVRLVRLAHRAWRQSSLAPLARPQVDALSRTLGETVHLAQMDNAQVLYVDKRNAAKPIEMYSQAGKVGPAYCTGVGKAMLAWMPAEEQERIISQQSFHGFTPTTLTTAEDLRAELAECVRRGFAFDNEEHEPGIICIAFPILSGAGRVMGGLSITSTTTRHSLQSLQTMVPTIRTAVDRIAEDVENWRFPDEIKERA
ncbi:IclR family transcriptional regulator [Litoreibacter roseus]|uniref:IclR family transcriptional regulator n=1 Tax=Litoreibacter roseus TaxID=2601869 RepID=A0A6N6JC36_9RHOB|nr:IclR family transcriptional regulator [Litoreibacter roseus]GFE62959.1 IclR family transcriptional regulator [Litoreibacter roseus]